MFARGRSIALVAAFGLLGAACGDDDGTGPGVCVSDVVGGRLCGEISTALTLDPAVTYTIEGVTAVTSGGSLTIPAGTLIQGSTSQVPSALIVAQGGQIFSNGTAADPVVFTSDLPAGSRSAGDWGGVVVNGRSICNFLTQPNPLSQCVTEGVPGSYGANPPILNDNSGTIRYTRIEFAGYEASPGNELNALTLNGVGSGTTLEYIQTHQGLDDGFEFFGGTVNLKYALATAISDDSFDYSTGWSGYGQFWIAQQDPANAESDQGFEVDGNENEPTATPFTDPMIWNVTLVGGGAGAANSDVGILLRLGTAGTISNAIVMGFQDAGIDIDNPETVTNGAGMQYSIVSDDNAESVQNDDESADGEVAVDDAAVVAAWTMVTLDTDPELANPYSLTSPDFQPMAGGNAATHAAAAAPAAAFFTAATYLGAVDPAAAGPFWYEGWTTNAAN
jgi:hypothetical protein